MKAVLATCDCLQDGYNALGRKVMTGFIGRHLVALLLQSGATVRVAVRHSGRVKMAAEAPKAPEIVQADILDDTSVGSAITGADAVVNLVGILTETPTQTYRAIHVDGARRVALAMHRRGGTRLIHISALGASLTSPAISDRTKAEGEHAVRDVFPQATIVRPSLTYGEDDHFFSRFASMIGSSPILPLIGGGTTKFQPVFVDDVTAGLLELLKRSDTAGSTYEFGGPQVHSFKDHNPLQRHRDGAARDAQRPGDLAVAGATFVFEPQDLAYSSHRHSLGWHRSPRSSLP